MTVNYILIYTSSAAKIPGRELCSKTEICLIFTIISSQKTPTRPVLQAYGPTLYPCQRANVLQDISL